MQVLELVSFLVWQADGVITETGHQGPLRSLLIRQWPAHLLELVVLAYISLCITNKAEDKDRVSVLNAMYSYGSDLVPYNMPELSLIGH